MNNKIYHLIPFLSTQEAPYRVKVMGLCLLIAFLKKLTRIFHANHLRKPGSQMDTALDFDLGNIYSCSRHRNPSPCLSASGFAAPRDETV
jgi:hypothetical protein